MIKRLAIIPARSGSVRIKSKNIKLFYNKPIINYVINSAVYSKLFHTIHVSTNSKKIREIVQKNKINVDFLRPNYLSKNSVPLYKVINYVLSRFEKQKVFFDEVWLIYSTAVLIDHKDLKKASVIFKKQYIKNIISVTKYPAPIEWAFELKNKILKPVFQNKILKDSKSFKTKYFENASFVAYKINKNKNYIEDFNNFYPFEIPLWKAIDIDDIDDWNTAKKLYLLKKTNKV